MTVTEAKHAKDSSQLQEYTGIWPSLMASRVPVNQGVPHQGGTTNKKTRAPYELVT